MNIQQKHFDRVGQVLLRLALLVLVVPFVIWLDIMCLLYWGDGILTEQVHDFHNSLPAWVQVFIWLGLPVAAIILGSICLARGYSLKISRSVIAAGVIFSVLALLAAFRP